MYYAQEAARYLKMKIKKMLILKKQYELEGILTKKWSTLHLVNHCLCYPLICILAIKKKSKLYKYLYVPNWIDIIMWYFVSYMALQMTKQNHDYVKRRRLPFKNTSTSTPSSPSEKEQNKHNKVFQTKKKIINKNQNKSM